MAITRSIGVKPIEDVGATPQDMKQSIGALFTQTAVNEPQLGVLAPCERPLVAGTSGLAYVVGKCQVAVSPGPGYGVHLLTVTDPTQAATIAGSATGTRIDLVTIRQQDPDVGDETNEPVIAVVNGDIAETNPVPPDPPPGALVLAQVLVPPGMGATNATGVNIQVTAPYTGLRGATVGEDSLQLPGVDGWNATGYVTKKLITAGMYEVHLNGRYQRTSSTFTVGGNWLNLLPKVVQEGYRPARNPNGDVMRATAHTYPWFPTGDVAQQASLQLQVINTGDVLARAMGGSVEIRQWGFVNIVMFWLVET